MKNVFSRCAIYVNKRFSFSFFLFLIASILGLLLGLSSCYFSAQDLYMETINTHYPAKIWLISKDGNTNLKIDIDIQSFIIENKNISEITVDTLEYKELALINHSNTQQTINQLNNMLDKEDPYVFVNATDFSIEQLIKTLEIQGTLQSSIIFGLVICTFLIFLLSHFVAIKKFNNDAYILKRIGETNKNIAIQFTLYQILTSLIPFLLFSFIALQFYAQISKLWIDTMIVDTNIMLFDEYRQFLSNVNSIQISKYSMSLYCIIFPLNIVMLLSSYFYYRMNK